MVDIRQINSKNLPQIEAAYPVSPGTPGNPHGERFYLHAAGDITWLAAWDAGKPCGSVTIRWLQKRGDLTEQARALDVLRLAVWRWTKSGVDAVSAEP